MDDQVDRCADNLRSHKNFGVLDNSSMSTLMRNIFLSFAWFERGMIVERIQEAFDKF